MIESCLQILSSLSHNNQGQTRLLLLSLVEAEVLAPSSGCQSGHLEQWVVKEATILAKTLARPHITMYAIGGRTLQHAATLPITLVENVGTKCILCTLEDEGQVGILAQLLGKVLE